VPAYHSRPTAIALLFYLAPRLQSVVAISESFVSPSNASWSIAAGCLPGSPQVARCSSSWRCFTIEEGCIPRSVTCALRATISERGRWRWHSEKASTKPVLRHSRCSVVALRELQSHVCAHRRIPWSSGTPPAMGQGAPGGAGSHHPGQVYVRSLLQKTSKNSTRKRTRSLSSGLFSGVDDGGRSRGALLYREASLATGHRGLPRRSGNLPTHPEEGRQHEVRCRETEDLKGWLEESLSCGVVGFETFTMRL
jgi:hypothetical protein